MKITCISDLHGQLPDIDPCDLLLIGGDICPVRNHTQMYQRQWLLRKFVPWLSSTPARKRILTWGNHDWIAEKNPALIPEMDATILVDQLCEWEGLKIYGLPWQRRFMDWAFNLDPPELARKYEIIPDCDIIISHGPPHGYGDYSPYEQERCGSVAFVEAIDRIQPMLVVFGHIHEGYGRYERGGTVLFNASIMDARYRPVNPLTILEMPDA